MLRLLILRFMKFCLEGGKFVVFSSEEAREAGPKILQQHAITFDRSADLREVQVAENGVPRSSNKQQQTPDEGPAAAGEPGATTAAATTAAV